MVKRRIRSKGDAFNMASSPPLAAEKKHWWLTNRKVADKYIKDARILIATQDQSEIASALNLLDAALSLYPRLETALELKARYLLCLRRFKDVVNMLQDHIPSLKFVESFSESSQQLSRDRVKLLSSFDGGSANYSSCAPNHPTFKCFSVSDLKKKVLAGLIKNCEKEEQWRYLVLGQACCHLGLMEDAMVLLQTGKRLATAAFRRESVCWSEDSFSGQENLAPVPETVNLLLGNIKFLLRRRAAALAALDAGLHSEAIRHFSKILEGRRGTPQAFVADCYIHRAAAYQAAGRFSESIADCNRTLALDPTCITALSTRARILETVRCFSDCLRDLEHLKLLYDSILRERKLPGPAWKRHNVNYRDIPENQRTLAGKIQELKQQLSSVDQCSVDYHVLFGLRRGCTRSELERAHLLLCLRHRPDKSTQFVDRCELVDDLDVDAVKDQARMSALLLYRLLQKAYSSVMASIMEEEAAEKQRQRAVPAPVQVPTPVHVAAPVQAHAFERKHAGDVEERCTDVEDGGRNPVNLPKYGNPVSIELPEKGSFFQGVFCREIAVVGSLLSQGFTHPGHHLAVKYEALSC